MRQFFTIVPAIMLAFGFSACATGTTSAERTVKTISVNLPEYTEIDASCGIEVTYTQGALTPAKVTAPAFVLDYLDIKVSNRTLDISLNDDFFKKYRGTTDHKVKVSLSAPAVSSFETSSGSRISVTGHMTIHGKASFEASSGSSISIPDGFTADGKIDFDCASAADITVGAATGSSCKIEASSGSGVTIKSLGAKAIDIEGSSACDINVDAAAAQSTIADLSSGASCTIAGITTKLSVDATSGSSFNGKKFKSRQAIIEASSGGSVDYNSQQESRDVSISGSATNHH